jgi:hypothetical protein
LVESEIQVIDVVFRNRAPGAVIDFFDSLLELGAGILNPPITIIIFPGSITAP